MRWTAAGARVQPRNTAEAMTIATNFMTRTIVRHGMLLTIVSLVIGLGGSVLLTPALQSFLIDLPASDPVTFGAVAVALVVIALVACYVPARRATRIEPIATLRAE
jgi:putative ABC transport system permease protein